MGGGGTVLVGVLSAVATVNVAFMHYIITVVFALRHATTRGS